MPEWAQWLGETMPATHFIRIARGVMLKASTFDDVDEDLAALVVIALVTTVLAIGRYRLTLDAAAKPAG